MRSAPARKDCYAGLIFIGIGSIAAVIVVRTCAFAHAIRMGQPTRQDQSPSVVARAPNGLQANWSLGFCFEIPV